MSKFKHVVLPAALLAALAAAAPAVAQKSKDTVRVTLDQVIPTLNPYILRGNQMSALAHVTYGHLIVFNEHTGKFLPELAKSWTRPTETTIEFDLRDDIKFTNGNKFTANDVKYILDYLKDPKLKISFKQRYTWIKSVEVLSPTKIRITEKKRIPDDFMKLAYWIFILDSKVHKSLETKADYGRTVAPGTNIYKVVKADRNSGVVLTRNEDAVGKWPFRVAKVKNYVAVPIPEQEVRLAKLLAGQVDVYLDPTPDVEKELRKNSNYKFSTFPSRYLVYLFLDAAGRSKQKLFTDIRVRKAFFKAIDREKLINTFIQAGKEAARPDAICFKEVVGCSYTTKPYGYDPAGAKKLLAEAGYPNGVDFNFYHNNTMTEFAAVVAGEIRKVGFRPKLIRMGTIGTQIRLRGRGEFTAFLARYPTMAQPNVENIFSLYFGANRDYYKDKVILGAMKKGRTVMDVEKRKAIYQKAFDQVNKMAYIYPISEKPNLYVHTKDVIMHPGNLSLGETHPTDYEWAK